MTRPLVDAHHIGLHQTGNETWALNVLRASQGTGDLYDYALSPQGVAAVEHVLEPSQMHIVAGSSARRLLIDLPRLARDLRPSALLVHYTRPIVSPGPLVVLVHDCSFNYREAREWLPPHSLMRYRMTVRASVASANLCLTPSEFVKRDLVKFYGIDPGKVLVAPCALAPDLDLAISRIPKGVKRREVLVVGNPLPRKNLKVVVDAVARLRRAGDSITLRLVGKVNSRGLPAVQYAESRLGDAFTATGLVTTDELAEAYATAGVLAYPSLSEGFGIPLLEAMAADVPCVVSNLTSLPEIAGDAAPQLPALDSAMWAEQLGRSLDHPEGWIEKGRRRLRDFSWEKTATVVRSALDSAAERRLR